MSEEVCDKSQIEFLSFELKKAYGRLAYSNLKEKAATEIALLLGENCGESMASVKNAIFNAEMGVLNSLHHPTHQTNSNLLIDEYRNFIEDQHESRKKDFQNEFIPLFLSGQAHLIGDEEFTSWHEAVERWMQLEQEGNKDAIKNLIVCFTNGYGVDKSPEYVKYLTARLEGKIVSKPELSKPANEREEVFLDNCPLVNYEEISDADLKDLQHEVNKLNSSIRKISNVFIKTPEAIEAIQALAQKYAFLPSDLKNQIFGAPLCLHTAEFDFSVENVKQYGSIFKNDKRGDVFLRITNNTDWTPTVLLIAKDDSGHTYQSRIKINPGTSNPIPLFLKHPAGSKIVSLSFETTSEEPFTFFYLPKNLQIPA